MRSSEDHQLGTGKPAYVISILENFSRVFLASASSSRQDLTADLIGWRAASESPGAPEVLVSDRGRRFKATHAQAIAPARGMQTTAIEQGQPWQNDRDTTCNVMRRMAADQYARAETWEERRAAHNRFFWDDNHQSQFAHRERTDGRQSPAAVLGWVHGAWCEPTDLDRLFRLRTTRVLNAAGSLRFWHWCLYGERGLAGQRAQFPQRRPGSS